MSSSEERLLLEIVGGDCAPAELPRSGMLAIGSSPDKAGMVLDGQGVADVHCAIGRTKDGGFAIKDLGSEYGTLLNGTKISQSRLGKGDEILIGSIRLKVVAAKSGGASAPAPRAKQAPAKKSARRSSSALPNIQGYKLQQRLGKGAMGDVYLAVQISLDREVALKVLSKKHEEDQAFVASFQAEARSAAALNHPNVVTVHDVGEQDGVHYLTMEYMDRGSLEDRVAKEGPLPWTIVLDGLKDAASGLVYAESRGIVHRDIKPANLMQNHAGATKIADLGLATSISSEEALEGDRKIFGTPHFISPEQIQGEKADCRSDLYSLGSTAYRLLTGHTPYEGKNTREILRHKLRGDHVPIQERATDVPEGLVVLVNRLMQLDPGDRYPSATALLREIERLQVGGQPGAAAGQPGEAAGMSGALKIGIGLGVVAVLAIAATFMTGGDPPRNDTANAGDAERNTEVVDTIPDEPEEFLPIGDVSEPEVDNDMAEQLFETAAENAYLRLGQQDLEPAERRDALRDLAREFFGTTTATTAIEEAETIDGQLLASAEAEGERNTALSGIFATLNEAAGLDDPALRPGNALRSMKAIEGLEAFYSDDAFVQQLSALESKVIATALEQFNAVLLEIKTLEGSGEFERAREVMTDLLGRCDLPAFEEGREPQRVADVESLASSLRTRLEGLDSLEVAYHERLRKEDREQMGREIGPQSNFLEHVIALDFASAAQQSTQLASGLQTEASQTWTAQLGAQLEQASQALPILVTNFAQWRRKAVPNPTEKRGGNRDVSSINASGLVMQVAGKQQDVRWADFGGHTKALHMLFSKRLKREYSAEEKNQIAALMHLAAVGESLMKAAEMFAPSSKAVFTSSEAEELPEAFNHALAWCTTNEQRRAVEQDQAASRLLGQALAHASDGAWSTTVAELEQLYAQYPDTRIVRLVSDGTSLTVPE